MAFIMSVVIFVIVFSAVFRTNCSLETNSKNDDFDNSLDVPLVDSLDAPLKAQLDISKLTKQLVTIISNKVRKEVNHACAELVESLVENKTKEATETLKTEVYNRILEKGQSSTYIRWARNECTAVNTELVYSGYAAGEKHYYSSSYRGGASNMLCLPSDPELSNKTAGGSSQIFGTEFEESYFGSDAVDKDVPCAFCRSTNTASSVMFPGRRSCYSGWKEEYRGILAASAYSHNPSPYICVDSHPTYVTGGQRSSDDHVLYTTKMKCGSLPCPPYKDNLEVFCVVCSK